MLYFIQEWVNRKVDNSVMPFFEIKNCLTIKGPSFRKGNLTYIKKLCCFNFFSPYFNFLLFNLIFISDSNTNFSHPPLLLNLRKYTLTIHTDNTLTTVLKSKATKEKIHK